MLNFLVILEKEGINGCFLCLFVYHVLELLCVKYSLVLTACTVDGLFCGVASNSK